DDGVAWVEALVRALQVPGLSRWGASAGDVPALVAKARAASSMKGNPVELDEAELAEIALASL
ncbi:MAG TPA: alcohol dehydrogenase, partial [Vicinamibacteria bacterium]